MEEKLDDELNKALEVANKNTGHGYSLIGENDTFQFQCQRCGGCCMGRDDIILNAWDVFNASVVLNISPEEFLKKYAIQTLGGFSKLPLVTLGVSEAGACHFLEFDYMDSGLFKCTINDHKPGACASHPLGIMTGYNMEKNDRNPIHSFIKVEQCENSKKPVDQKVSEWMKHYYNHKDEFEAAHAFVNMYTKHRNFRKWYFMSTIIMEFAKITNEDPHDDLVIKAFSGGCSAIIHHTYANYDITQPFLPQAESNLKELDEFMDKLDNIIDTVENSLNEALKDAGLDIDGIIKANDAEDGPHIDLSKLAIETARKCACDNKGGN